MTNEKTGCIYLITNTVNGKRYVGKTEMTLSRRWIQHKSAAKRDSTDGIHRAIRKYGQDSFSIEEVCSAPFAWLPAVEMAFIHILGTFKSPQGYNMTPGGEGVMTGRTHSEETKRKLSEHQRGKSPGNKGKPMSDEQKAKLSAINKGKTLSAEHRQALSRGRTGRVLSMETRNKISAARRGWVMPEEQKRKHSAALKGRPSSLKGRTLSAEHRARVSAACLGRPSPMKGKKYSAEHMANRLAAIKVKADKEREAA